MKKWIGQHKNEIIVAIISTFITTVFFSILNWVKDVGPSAGNSLFMGIRNYVFYQTAHQTSYFLIFFILMSLCCFYFVYQFSNLIGAMRAVRTTLKLEEANSILAELEKSNEDDHVKRKERIEELKSKLESLHNTKGITTQTLKKDKWTLRISALFMVFYVVYIIFSFIIPALIHQTFEMAVTEIAPYVEEYDVKMLRSKWVSMRTYDDYLEISNYIKEVKEENGLPL